MTEKEYAPGLGELARQRPVMRRDLFVYLSGPMTAKHGYSVEENVAAGLRVFLDCLRRGIPAFSPHLCGAFPSAWSDVPWEQWLAYDYAVIDRCTHVLLLPRWETSAGAVKERAYAEQIGVPIVNSVDEVSDSVARCCPACKRTYFNHDKTHCTRCLNLLLEKR